MSRFPRATALLVPILAACSTSSAPTPATPDDDRRAIEELRRDLAAARAPVGAECDMPGSDALSRVKAEVWGKNDGPPGLPARQVEAFLCRQRHELASACWRPKFAGWERSEIEYGLVVDPSGAVLSNPDESADAATAALERGSARSPSPELAHCVESVVSLWTFPRATMPTWMRLTFRVPD
jgi:hypothetical protein